MCRNKKSWCLVRHREIVNDSKAHDPLVTQTTNWIASSAGSWGQFWVTKSEMRHWPLISVFFLSEFLIPQPTPIPEPSSDEKHNKNTGALYMYLLVITSDSVHVVILVT